jgi:hypothetical protein
MPLKAENTFLLFKERRPFKLKKEYPLEQWQVINCRLIPLKTPLSFRWTVPLRVGAGATSFFFPEPEPHQHGTAPQYELYTY